MADERAFARPKRRPRRASSTPAASAYSATARLKEIDRGDGDEAFPPLAQRREARISGSGGDAPSR